MENRGEVAVVSEQEWSTCRFSVAANGGGEMAHELREHGLNEIYGCSKPMVVRSGIYSTQEIQEPNGSLVQVAILERLMISDVLSLENASRVSEQVGRSLDICRICPLYQPKVL